MMRRESMPSNRVRNIFRPGHPPNRTKPKTPLALVQISRKAEKFVMQRSEWMEMFLAVVTRGVGDVMGL